MCAHYRTLHFHMNAIREVEKVEPLLIHLVSKGQLQGEHTAIWEDTKCVVAPKVSPHYSAHPDVLVLVIYQQESCRYT